MQNKIFSIKEINNGYIAMSSSGRTLFFSNIEDTVTIIKQLIKEDKEFIQNSLIVDPRQIKFSIDNEEELK